MLKLRSVVALAVSLSFLSSPLLAADVKLAEKGFAIDAGAAGSLLLSYPRLTSSKDTGPAEVKIDGTIANLKYASGASARIETQSAGGFLVHFSNLPTDVHAFGLQMSIPMSLKGTAMWQMDKRPAQPLPADYVGKTFLYQGDAKRFLLHCGTGASDGADASTMNDGVAIWPGTGFQQLQDNREWKEERFLWLAKITLTQNPPGQTNIAIRISSPSGAEPVVTVPVPPPIPPRIDRFGQFIDKQFPEKVKTEDELKQDVKADADYFATLNPPALDPYGGLPGSGEKYHLKKTGFFHIETSGKSQIFADPDGNAFFQLGVCDITPGDDYTLSGGRRGIFQWLPSGKDPMYKSVFREGFEPILSFHLVNLVRKFGQPFEPVSYVQRWVGHLRKWGFNSGGAWAFNGDKAIGAASDLKFPRVGFVPLGAPSLPVKDMWDPFADGIDEKMDAAMAKRIAPSANDPMIIGYFLSNEPLVEDIPKAIPGLKGSKYAAKRRLVQMLEEKYKTIDAFNTSWDVQPDKNGKKPAAFDDLKDMPLVITTKAASEDMRAYYELFLEQRYSLINKYFHKYDSNHLLIGDRWMPGTANSEPLVRIASKYLDVISVNYYTYGIDKTFLQRIHDWSGGKPMLLSEFYYAARDQGLSGGTVQVASQEERGLAYRNYVEQSASTGFVVGIQWFEANDEATSSRFFDGENGNTGLVNVTDRPYKAYLAEAMKTNYDIYNVVFGQRPPFAYSDPRFSSQHGGRKTVQIARMPKPVSIDGQRTGWPGEPPTRIGPECLVSGQDAKDFEASYWLAWDEDNLYVFTEINDTTPMGNHLPDDSIWANDAVELFTGFDDLDTGGSLSFSDRQVLVRGGPTDADHAPMVYVNAPKKYAPGKSAVVAGLDGKSYTLEASIPFEALGFHPKVGQEILFDLAVDDGGNGRRMLAWNGTARDSKDRGSWGRAEFTN